MDRRYKELLQLKEYTSHVENEAILLLKNLQWDPKQLTEKCATVACKHDVNHRIPLVKRDTHEKQCYLTRQGYPKHDLLLPDPVDPNSSSVFKLSKQDINKIINIASTGDPLFKKGEGCVGPEPLSAARLQQVYSADERRALHDAVVSAAPFCHDLTQLHLPSGSGDPQPRRKSRMEVLAELRDMRRRRTKYRVAPKTTNYSDVLRDLIGSQMELYGEATKTIIQTEYGPNVHVSQNVSEIDCNTVSQHEMIVETEIDSPEHSYRERRRARHRERDDDDRRDLQKYRSRDSRDVDDDQSHYNGKQRHRTDKYFSKERGRYHSRESNDSRYHYRDRSREKSYDGRRTNRDEYTKDRHKSQHSKHDIVFKQERESPESEYFGRDARDRSISKDEIQHAILLKQEKESAESEYLGRDARDRSISKDEIQHANVFKQERESPESEYFRRDARDRSIGNNEKHYSQHTKNDRDDKRDKRSIRHVAHVNSDGRVRQKYEHTKYTSNGSYSRKRRSKRSRSKERRYDDKKSGHRHKRTSGSRRNNE